jgi:hypothetical protein
MKKFNINKFIEHTNNNPLGYIDYCEIIIDGAGIIFEAHPSHVEAILRYIGEKDSRSREQIMSEIPLDCLPIEYLVDKYGLVAVWSCGYMYSSYYRRPNKFQKRCLDMLEKNNLIRKDYVKPAVAYKMLQFLHNEI